jgi:ABC-type sugar transport system ATPase subunit
VSDDVHVRLLGVSKRFGGAQALVGIDLEILRGGVHALVGENGAGKSTLGKIVAGIHAPDTGSVFVDDEEVSFHDAHAALAHGITMIAQELPLVPGMSVLDNVFLGIETHRLGVVETAATRKRLQELMDRTGFRLAPSARVGTLRLADQQKTAILRALARDARLIVMDEPTAALPQSDASALLDVTRALANGGTTIVFVSHFLKDVLDVADTVTVLKDGRLVRTELAEHESESSLVAGMLGRDLGQRFPARVAVPDDEPVLRVESLTRKGAFADATFELRPGEIVGLAGLVGSGRSELARAIAGVDRFDSGRIVLRGRELAARHPGAAIEAGVMLIPDNRRADGLIMGRSIRENVTVPHLGQVSRLGLIRSKVERDTVDSAAAQSGVTAPRSQTVETLSGGNQQKVMFAKWLVRRPDVLVADEPTRGIDVGAKRAIYDILTALASSGVAILLISNEVDELLGLSNRILVMRRGRLVSELDATQATEDALMRAAFGTDVAQAV